MRLLTAAVCAVLAAALFAAGAVAERTLAFTLEETQGPTAAHPHPPAGEVGDTFVSSLALTNAAAPQLGKRPWASVGTMQFTYTIRHECASLGTRCVPTADFDTVTTLPGGTVVADGHALSIARPTITIPVVDGTGRYAGARGTVTISPTSTKVSRYKLTLP